ncbi:hypothetical protein D3C78_1442230 [compost metagenome]
MTIGSSRCSHQLGSYSDNLLKNFLCRLDLPPKMSEAAVQIIVFMIKTMIAYCMARINNPIDHFRRMFCMLSQNKEGGCYIFLF